MKETYKSRVFTDRPDYADFEPAAKFEAIKSIIAKRLREHPNAICSYSSGSDSDIMIDVIEQTRMLFNLPPVKYLAEYLLTRGDASEALFVTERTYKNAAGQKEPKRMGKLAYENIAKDTAVEANITDKVCTVHVYRKTFATRMAERGCPLEIIQELLGHADAGTTSKHYVAKSKQRIKKECEKYMAA